MKQRKIRKGFQLVEYIDEDGKECFYLIDKRIHFTYVLFKNSSPIYVGTTTNIKKRIYDHKKARDFDCYLQLGSNYTDVQATTSEKTIISLLKKLYPDSMLNVNSCKGCSDFIKI